MMFLHALAWLRQPEGERSWRIYLSRSHAKRRVWSAALILFEIVWLTLGMTVFRRLLFASRRLAPAMIFALGMSIALIAILVLAFVDFVAVTRSHRGTRDGASGRSKDEDQRGPAAPDDQGDDG